MAETAKPSIKSSKSDVQSRLRRLSARAAQASGATRKQSAKSQIEELKLENVTLKEKLEQETKAKQQLIDTLQSLMCKVVEYIDVDELNTFSDPGGIVGLGDLDHPSPDMDYSKLPACKLLHMFTVLLEDKFGEDSDHMVTRLEELETRVTEQAQEIAEQVLLRMKLQNGLEALDQCNTLKDVQDQIEELKLSTGIVKPGRVNDKWISPVTDVLDGCVMSTPEPRYVSPPAVKLPAETHIQHLHGSIKESIIRELSQFKTNGADWRMFAQRVGIADEMVNRWKRQPAARPMEAVLREWGRSKGASVRMLHRHLLSPQLRCRILAKRLADFYAVS